MNLQSLIIKDYTTFSGHLIPSLELSYEVFGDLSHVQEHGVLACHALTGNSHVAGDQEGWWFPMIGKGKMIDPEKHPVICFNIPGNGFDKKKENLILNYQDFNVRDVAQIFLLGLAELGISKMHSTIGASLGGAVIWELALLAPTFFDYIVPVCSHYQSTDWIIGHNHIQFEILKNANNGLEIARMMAMLFYRTPLNFDYKFERSFNQEKNIYNVSSYLEYQGKKLKSRFTKEAYLLMTQLLSTIDVFENRPNIDQDFAAIKSKAILIAIEPDFLFPAYLSQQANERLKKAGVDCDYIEIKTQHGHDSFFIEYEQIKKHLSKIY